MEFRGVHVLMRTSRRARSRSVEAFDPPLRDAQRVQKTMGVRNDDDEIDDGGLFLARSRARARRYRRIGDKRSRRRIIHRSETSACARALFDGYGSIERRRVPMDATTTGVDDGNRGVGMFVIHRDGVRWTLDVAWVGTTRAMVMLWKSPKRVLTLGVQ